MSNPYRGMPDKAFWRRSVAQVAPAELDPVGVLDLKITPDMKVATAGSCFAQHIARHLQKAGFNYHVVEKGHPLLGEPLATNQGYGLYSARYGNIYTTRQLRQLIDRAYGRFSPKEDVWIEADGTVLDPFRPSVQPNGFVSEEEMRRDREWHLDCVRTMVETLDVFVFTLGLTECWMSREDGAVFPICPGVAGGTFDPESHVFHNMTVSEVVEDMKAVIAELRERNPTAEVLLTVSPVPLAATAQPGAHVLSATTYSKAVLRAAAGMLSDADRQVHYFPSFEIITSNASRGRYYLDDLRNVTEEGVSHVMGLVLKHATSAQTTTAHAVAAKSNAALSPSQSEVAEWVEVMCDEETLDQ